MAIDAISAVRALEMNPVAQIRANRQNSPARETQPKQTTQAATQPAAPSPLAAAPKPDPARVYQAADSNRDNRISQQESQLYTMLNPGSAESSQPIPSPSNPLQKALGVYKQNMQGYGSLAPSATRFTEI